MIFSLIDKQVNPMIPDAGQTGKTVDTIGDVIGGEIKELEKRKQLLVDEIAVLTHDRDKLWDDARAQVMKMMREFVIDYFDEEFATAFQDYSEKYRQKENKIDMFG